MIVIKLTVCFVILRSPELESCTEHVKIRKIVTGEAVTCLVYPRFLHENGMYSIENRLSYFFCKADYLKR